MERQIAQQLSCSTWAGAPVGGVRSHHKAIPQKVMQCSSDAVFRANHSRASLINGDGRKNIQLTPPSQSSVAHAAEVLDCSGEHSQSIDNNDFLKIAPDDLVSTVDNKTSSFSPMLNRAKSASARAATPGSLRMTIMLLSVSFTFMLTTLPMIISNIIANPVINTGFNSDRTVAQGLLVYTLALLLMYLNHSVNFLLYCVTGKKFRKVVTRMYSAKMCALTQRKSTESNLLDHSEHLYCSRGKRAR